MSRLPTRCVILAAGMSTRLRPLTNSLPKCLLQVGGKTILERMVESLYLAGISHIACVVGFHAGKIRTHLWQKFPARKFHFILNPNFASTNNGYSLLLARRYFEESNKGSAEKEPLLIMDADILFHPAILAMIGKSEAENKLAFRTRGEHDYEEVQVAIDRSGYVVAIGKGAASGFSSGESIGIELFGYHTALLMFNILEHRVKNGFGRSEYYETSFQKMVEEGTKIKAVDVGDLPVAEIDSQADLDHAERVIIPKIDLMSHV
jgi:choline kinase